MLISNKNQLCKTPKDHSIEMTLGLAMYGTYFPALLIVEQACADTEKEE